MRALCQQPQRRRLEANLFLTQNVGQVGNDLRRRHLLQIELQAARQHRDRDLLRVGGGKNEFDMRRRLFKRFQHGVEGVVGEHVDFVDHVDLEACIRRCIHRLLQQLRHFINPAVGGSVDFDVVDKASGIDRHAGIAYPAGGAGNAAAAIGTLAIEGFSQDARQRGLADAAGAGEQISVVQAAAVERMRQCPHHVLLSDQSVESFGTIFKGKDLI